MKQQHEDDSAFDDIDDEESESSSEEEEEEDKDVDGSNPDGKKSAVDAAGNKIKRKKKGCFKFK